MRKRNATRLHMLSVRQIQTLGEGDHGDGGGLVFRVRGDTAHFIFRFTAPTGNRREMGLGAAHRGNAAQAGQCLTAARELAADARAQLQRGLDPIDERDRVKNAARAEAQAVKVQSKREQLTLARAARAYHERVIEPSRTVKHAAQWIASLENHLPPELWNAPLATITAPALLDFVLVLHNAVPETAMRVRQRLEARFSRMQFFAATARQTRPLLRVASCAKQKGGE